MLLNYINKLKMYNLCSMMKHRLFTGENWNRHCPQYEVLSFYEFDKINI